MEWLLIIFYIILFSVIIYRFNFFKDEALSPKFFLLAFALKVICAWSYYWLHVKFNFGGDSIEFVSNGKYLSDLFSTNKKAFFEILTGTGNDNELLPYYNNITLWAWFNSDWFYNDSHTLVRLNALINFITGGYYMVNAIWFAFFSMMGFTALFKVFSKIDSSKSLMIFSVMFFIPSTFFWTAGVSKEAWLICLLGIFLFSLYCLNNNNFNVKYLVISLLAGYLLIYIKVYFLLALIPVLFSFFIADKLKKVNPVIIYFGVYIAGIIILILLPGFNFINYLSQKQHDFVNYTAFVQSKSVITLPILENSWWSFLENTPRALWNILTRPYPWEAKSFFWIFASIENVLILFLMIFVLLGFRFNRQHASISYACLFYAVSIFVIIGLTTPVIGSLLRYKAPLIPFLLMFFIFHFDVEKFRARVRFVNF